MDVEDTKDRVYIHDLDQELADIESDEEHPIFLPDIEKHLLRLPKSVLMNDADKLRMENMQLVPYRVPKSLSVPVELDSVRKAILEARERARLGRLVGETKSSAKIDSTKPSQALDSAAEKADLDAMDES